MSGLPTQKHYLTHTRVFRPTSSQRLYHPAGSLFHYGSLVGAHHRGARGSWRSCTVPHLEAQNIFRLRRTAC